jgi:hypothetical protein
MPGIAERLLPFAMACAVVVAALPAALPAHAAVQSDGASRQSATSLDASVEVPVAAAHALSEGAKFSVTAIEASGNAVAVTVSAVGAGASLVVKLSAEQARTLGLSVGASVVITAVAAGWLISDAAGHVFCFVPDERARRHLHSRRLS